MNGLRYSLIIGALLLIGIGEYAFVELAPLNPQQRKERLERLPVVKYIVHWDDFRLIHEAFDHDRGATMKYRTGRLDTLWTSPSDLFDAFVKGHSDARRKVQKLRDAEENRINIPGDRALALEGSTWHKILYRLRSDDSYEEYDRVHSMTLLKADSSATAQWYAESIENGPGMSFDSTKGMVLWTRFILEDLHYPGDDLAEAHKHDDQLVHWLVTFVDRAEEGEPEAIAALNQLKDEWGINLPSVIANWESIRTHRPSS